MKKLVLSSPAKLNLYLKVLNKRPDGYHNLITLFERISLCDRIELKTNASGRIRIFCSHPQVPRGPQNLVFKAARLLQNDFNIRQGVDIKIIKNIPVAAGLAGGSSNAATVLLGLNKLWGLKLGQKTLVDYASRIGSDVAFFCYDCRFALGKRRGETIEKLLIDRKLWHILVVPKVKMYTKDVFNGLKLKLTKKESNVNILIRCLIKNNIFNIGQLLSNSLEPSILTIRPQLVYLKQKINRLNTLGVCFSGSGPSVYGLVASEKEARLAAKVLRRQYSRVFVVSTL